MNKKFVFLFFSILFIGLFLRLYKISEIPPGVNRDEASIGYTAYSLLQTGKDEYGRSYPLSFQSFGDWKLPLYIYLTVPFVYIFGITELAVRLPSALFGIGSVALTFFLVQQLFQNNRLSFLTMFLMAVSPWSLHLSRVESESNTAVFLTTLAVLLFFKSFNKYKWLLIPSAIAFAFTYFTYAGNYVFTTLLVLGLVFFYRKELFKEKYFVFSVVLFLVISVFIVFVTIGANRTKISGIGIFGDPSIVHAKIEIPRNQHVNPNSLIVRILHNRFVFGAERFFQNYFKSFSAEFLFIKGGDNKAHNIGDFGNIYLVEAPFLFLGISYLLFFKKGKGKQLVVWWFFIAPIAASITKDAPHTNRMFAIFPILPLVTAIGIDASLTWISNNLKRFSYVAISVIVVVFMLNILTYLDRYFIHFPKNEQINWGVGYEGLSFVLTSQNNISKHVIITRPTYSQYIFLLFYQAYNPQQYQRTVERYLPTDDGFVHVKKFDRYEFRQIDWNEDLKIKDTLLVADPSEVPDSVKNGDYSRSEITLANGKTMFVVVETK